MEKIKVFVFTVSWNAHNATIIDAILQAEDLELAGVCLGKSMGGDLGWQKKWARMKSYGWLNLAKIYWQQSRYRRQHKDDYRQQQALIRSVEAQIFGKQIPVFQGKSLRSLLRQIDDLGADIHLSVYFNRIIPSWFIDRHPAIFNIHPGKLPEYRGVQAVFWTLKEAAARATVSLHQLEKGIDTGPVIYENHLDIVERSIHRTLLGLSRLIAVDLADLLRKIHRYPSTPQEENKSRYFKRPDSGDIREFLKAGNRYF